MVDPFIRMMWAPRAKVLGKTLRPVSAYHLTALAFLESPFYCGGTPQPSDILAAICLLETEWQNGMDQVAAVDMEMVQEWGATLGKLDWSEAEAGVQAHINFYLDELPEMWIENGKPTKPSALPYPALFVSAVLIHMPGIPEADVWNMPFHRLAAYRAAIAENNGYEIVGERDRAAFRIRDQLRAEAAKVKHG